MSVMIAKGSSFLGVPLVKVRNALKAWHRGNRDDIWRIAERRDVDLDPRTVMVLLQELRDRGLMGPEEQEHGPPEDGLTEAGLALTGADARRRTPKDRAQVILDRLLDSCAAVNARDDLPFEVEEVWLYGSMIDPAKDDVADIDIVVVQAKRETAKDIVEAYRVLARGFGAPAYVQLFQSMFFVQRRLLYGERRNPLFSEGDLETLRDMACPCRLVFSARRGGRVDDPTLHRHHDSVGRSNRVGDRRRMPDLAEGRQPLRPVSAALMATHSLPWWTLEGIGPWPPDDWRYRAVIDQSRYPILVSDGRLPTGLKPNALTKRLRLSGCDGYERTGLILIDLVCPYPDDWRSNYERAVGAFVLDRVIERRSNSVTYRLDLADVDHLGYGPNYNLGLVLEWWLHLIVSTDLELILRREGEEGALFDINVHIENSANRSLTDYLSHWSDIHSRDHVGEARVKFATPTPHPRHEIR